MTLEKLRKLISGTPASSGVYFFTGPKKRILYIGKAANLKSRLFSYLKTSDNRIRTMINSADSVRFQVTDSDIEALILESKYIKELRPKFNIMLRDDKQYFYVGITEEEFPRIFLTHQPNNPKKEPLTKTAYFGPFTDGSALKTTLRFLRRIFPYCTCMQKHNIPCLNSHIGKCLGICCLKKLSPEHDIKKEKIDYQKNILAIKAILDGKKATLIRALKKDMRILAGQEQLERAIEIRNKIDYLERIFKNAQINRKQKHLNRDSKIGVLKILKEVRKTLNLKALPKRIEGYDISNIQGKFATGSMVAFEDGKPAKNWYRRFKIRYLPEKTNDTAMLQEILSRRFNHTEWPKPNLIVIDGGKSQVNYAAITLKKKNINGDLIGLTKDKKHRGSKITFTGDQKPMDLRLLPPVVANLILSVDGEAHRFAINYYRKRHKIL